MAASGFEICVARRGTPWALRQSRLGSRSRRQRFVRRSRCRCSSADSGRRCSASERFGAGGTSSNGSSASGTRMRSLRFTCSRHAKRLSKGAHVRHVDPEPTGGAAARVRGAVSLRRSSSMRSRPSSTRRRPNSIRLRGCLQALLSDLESPLLDPADQPKTLLARPADLIRLQCPTGRRTRSAERLRGDDATVKVCSLCGQDAELNAPVRA